MKTGTFYLTLFLFICMEFSHVYDAVGCWSLLSCKESARLGMKVVSDWNGVGCNKCKAMRHVLNTEGQTIEHLVLLTLLELHSVGGGDCCS